MMFPNLTAGDDMPDEVFPNTAHFLFVGGPRHAHLLEVPVDEVTWIVLAPAQTQPALFAVDQGGIVPPVLAGGYESVRYVRQALSLPADNGTAYRRYVFFHDAIPDPDVAQRLLMSALLARFVMDGELVDVDS